MLRLPICHWKLCKHHDHCEHHQCVKSFPIYRDLYNVISIIGMGNFRLIPIYDMILLTISNLTQIFLFNLNHIFWFNLTHITDLIQIPLHVFDSLFIILPNSSDSILLVIYDSVLLSLPLLFNSHCTNPTYHSQFDTDFLIQIDSAFLI